LQHLALKSVIYLFNDVRAAGSWRVM